MIKSIIDLLNVSDFYGVSKNIDTAKGIYKYPRNIRESKMLLKRIWKSKM
jgi:hypothetical protein